VIYIVYSIAGLTLALFPPTRLGLWIGLLWLVYFGVVAVIDLEYRVVLDQVSLADPDWRAGWFWHDATSLLYRNFVYKLDN
jgi:hypothetical protein